MKWSKKQITALKKSIKKWKKIVDGKAYLYDEECACCIMTSKINNVDCRGCPICEYTKKEECLGSPYYKFLNHSNKCTQCDNHEWESREKVGSGSSYCNKGIELAKKELEFLEKVLKSGI